MEVCMKKESDIMKRSIKKPSFNMETSSFFDIGEKRMSLVRYEEYILKQLKEKQKKAN
jgi:hypothetical protein